MVIELRVAVTTRDFERLKQFYCDGLGLEPAELWTSEHDSALLIDMGRGSMEILDEPHAAKVDEIEAGRRVSGHIRFALQVPDLQQAIDRLVAKGAKVVHPPVVTPWRHRNVRLEDPDGLQVTLFQVLDPQ
jgi:catechol 2,3-dioxygenase-like lactoylglutathione lyase family enzyme